jgi:hypothetical protein
MKVGVWIVAGVVAPYMLHRLALWMEGKGWLYYKNKQAPSSMLGNAFLEVQSMVDPGKRLILEAKRETNREDDESGDPPGAGMRTADDDVNSMKGRKERCG